VTARRMLRMRSRKVNSGHITLPSDHTGLVQSTERHRITSPSTTRPVLLTSVSDDSCIPYRCFWHNIRTR